MKHPNLGIIIEEYLEALGQTRIGLALETRLSIFEIDDILDKGVKLTDFQAKELEKALGRPAHFWKNIQELNNNDK